MSQHLWVKGRVSPYKIKTLGMGPATQIEAPLERDRPGGIEKSGIPDRRVEIELDMSKQ